VQITAAIQPIGVSVTEAARRAQILNATVATLAEHGYAKTSLDRIRARAGLSSTRIITYHFGDKADLLKSALGAIVYLKDELTRARTDNPGDRKQALRAYIEAEVAFLREYPEGARALDELRTKGEPDPITAALVNELRFGRLARQLGQGQKEGVFGAFAPEVMARTIAHALDGAAAALAADPDLDLTAYGHELADLFEKATRA
jgi:AcrR family transcriptional regulator